MAHTAVFMAHVLLARKNDIVATTTGGPKFDWQAQKAFLRDPTLLLQQLAEFDASRLEEWRLELLLPMVANPDLAPARIGMATTAGRWLVQFVRSTVAFAQTVQGLEKPYAHSHNPACKLVT